MYLEKKFRWFQRDSNPWPLRCQCSALTDWAMKLLSWELLNLLGWCVPVKGMNEWKQLYVKCGFEDELKKSSSQYLYLLLSMCRLPKFDSGLTAWMFCIGFEENASNTNSSWQTGSERFRANRAQSSGNMLKPERIRHTYALEDLQLHVSKIAHFGGKCPIL